MSLSSWRAEFIPTLAFRRPPHRMSDVTLLEEAALKWRGLRKENLERHECFVSQSRVVDVAGIDVAEPGFYTGNCGLCDKHIKRQQNGDKLCTTCPLFKSNEYHACDESAQECEDEEKESCWHYWACGKNTEPMENLIAKALTRAEHRWWEFWK